MEITEMLQRHHPLVKAMSFVGQSTVARGGRGFSQKEQLKVVKEFREGGFNTLIATCVGEEGLDIGEVDLIICYDAPKSPIRLVQRMGRTGRKRDGRIVVLVTAGKEEQMYNQSQYQKKSINAVLADMNRLSRFLSPHSSRMVPGGITPVCLKLHMKVGTWKIQTSRGRKSSVGPTTSIASMLGNSGPSSTNKRKDFVNKSGLSKEEFTWWRENLEVPLEEVKSIRRPSLLCRSKQETEEDFNSMHYINLGTYQPWQTMAQSTHVMGHSSRTLHLVEVAEFIGLQQHFDADDDPYGLEMAAFLDMAYIEGNTVQKPSIFSSIRSNVCRNNQQTVTLQESGEIKKRKGRKKGSAPKRKGAKKSVQSSLITTMFSQKPRTQAEEPKFSNCQDLEDFDVTNKDTDEDQSEVEIIEVKVIDEKDIDHVEIPSASPCKKNTDACAHVLEFLTLLPPKQRSPLHIREPPCVSDFSSDDQELEPPSPTDIVNVYNEWMEKKMDVIKNVFKLKSGAIHASDAIDVSVNPFQRLNIVKSKLMTLNEADDSLVDLPDLQGHQENIYKKFSITKVSLEAVSPVLGNKMTSTTSQIINMSGCESNETELVTSQDIFDDSTVLSDQKVSPVLSSSYKKPVRTNLTLYSSTPKITAKRLFKIATPDLTVIEQNSPISRELDKSCTPIKSLTAANLRRKQLIQSDSENAELEAKGSPLALSYRSKVRTKLSRFTIPEDSKSKDKPETSSLQKYKNPTDTSKGIDTNQISRVPVISNKDVTTNKDITPNKALMTNRDVTTNKAVTTNKDVTTNKAVTINKPVTINCSRECSVNFNLSLDDDLFADIEEEGDKANGKELDKIEEIEPYKKAFVIPARQLASEKTTKLTMMNTEPLANTSLALLSVTQIIDLVNESADNRSCKTIDSADASSHSFQKNTAKLMGNLSKSFLSKSNSCDYSVKNAGSVETVKQASCLDRPNFSLLDGLVSDDEDKPDGVKEESSNEQSVHFDLLGTDEFDLMSESLLADVELNIQMEDEGKKIPRKKGINDGASCVDKENKDKCIIQNNIPVHNAEYQKNQNLIDSKSPGRLKFSDTVLSPTQENAHVWQRKRKRHNVVGSDTEEYVTVSSDSENDTHTRSGSSHIDKSSSSGDNNWINRKKKKMFGIKSNFEDDDDFEEDSTASFQKMKQKSERSRKEPHKDMKKKNLFIEDEAELSENGDCVSSDENEEDEGDYDHSFVDDCTQLTQDTAVDMKAVYLQSVVSPLKMTQKNRHHHQSQLSDTDESIQEMEDDEDSFVVDNNFVEYDTEYRGDSMLAEDPIIAQALHDEIISKKSKDAEKGSKTKRKRIIVHDSSSDEESGHNSKGKSGPSLLRQIHDDCSSSLLKSSHSSIQDQDFVMQRYTTKNKTASSNILGIRPSNELQILQCSGFSRLHSNPEWSVITKSSKLSENERSSGGSSSIHSLSQRYSADQQCKTELPTPALSVLRLVPVQKELFGNSASEGFCMPSEDLNKDDKETHVARVLPSKSNNSLASSMRTEAISSIPDSVTDLKVSVSNVKMPNKHRESQCGTHLSDSQPSTSTFSNTKQVAAMVLVDSCEISGAGNIVSRMRLQYGASTAVVHLAHAHYAVSTRMAVTRLLHSVFSSSQQRVKLVQRVQGMLDLYERPVIIVEMDRFKAGETPHHGLSRSRYLDTITCACTQVTQLKVLYSSGQDETTLMLLKLAEQESSKGYSIPVMPEHLTQLKQVVNFYLSLPRISYAAALCLAKNFRTIADFINSPAEVVRDKGRISIQRATAIKQYLHRDFRPDMLPPH